MEPQASRANGIRYHSQQNASPRATIYATLCGSKAVENLDEQTFNAMSDEEFYTYRSLVQDARQQPQQGNNADTRSGNYATPAQTGLNKIFGWLGLR